MTQSETTAATTTPAAALRVSHLSKTYAGTKALNDVSLSVTRGTIHALLGGNGSGKSTLIKILAGVITGDPGGDIAAGNSATASDRTSPTWARGAGLSFVHQDLGLFPELTVAENLATVAGYSRTAATIRWRSTAAQVQRLLDSLHITVDSRATLGSLPAVEQTLVAVARALGDVSGNRPNLVVLDEPTARMPASQVQQLLTTLRALANNGTTIIYVSHRVDEVLDVASQVSVLRDGRHVETRPTSGLGESELSTLIVGRDIATNLAERPSPASATPLLAIRHLSGGALDDINLDLAPGEAVGIAGLPGAGSQDLLEMIYGARKFDHGQIAIDDVPVRPGNIAHAVSAGLAYIPPDRATSGIFEDLEIGDNLMSVNPAVPQRRFWSNRSANKRTVKNTIEQCNMRVPSPNALLHQLSGGNQQKILLARWLTSASRVLLLNEPTQGVDVGSRADIHGQIRAALAQGRSAIVVSTDFDELARLCNRVLVLRAGRIATELSAATLTKTRLIRAVYGTTTEQPS